MMLWATLRGTGRYFRLPPTSVTLAAEVRPMLERDLVSRLHAYGRRVDLAYRVGPIVRHQPPFLQRH